MQQKAASAPLADVQIASAPAEEDCAQVGSAGYAYRARLECWALMQQLRRLLGPEPPGVKLYVKSNPHDFGSYLAVHCSYPPNDEVGIEYALRCEAELPARWDQEARRYLGLGPTPKGNPPKKRPRTSKSKLNPAPEPKSKAKTIQPRKGGRR